jgi:hypothetical protein
MRPGPQARGGKDPLDLPMAVVVGASCRLRFHGRIDSVDLENGAFRPPRSGKYSLIRLAVDYLRMHGLEWRLASVKAP